MNDIQLYYNQQTGIQIRKTYDSILYRLRVSQHDEYQKILPTSLANDIDVYDPPIFACKFAPNEGHRHVVALANEDGRLAVHNTMGKREDRHGIQAHHNAIFDLSWMFGEMKLVSASGDHTARLFSVSNTDIVEERIFNGHTRSVKTVASRTTDPAVFATGARDGSILIWDTRAVTQTNFVCQPDSIISYSHPVPSTPSSHTKFKKKQLPNVYNLSGANSVTGLVFQDDMTLISCGAGDGVIKAWDLRKNYKIYKREPIPKHSIPYSGHSQRYGFSNLILDPGTLKLYANCLDNNIYCYNVSSYDAKPVMIYSGHQNSTFYIKSSLSPDGRYLLSGSSDQNAYVWNVNCSVPLLHLAGHRAEVTCVAWSQMNNVLITCSDDMRHLVWRVGDEALPDDWDVIGRGSTVYDSNKRDAIVWKTPRSNKRRSHVLNDATPYSSKKRSRFCEKCIFRTPGNVEENVCDCRNVTSLRKRLTDAVDSRNDAKRARRLFEPIDLNKPSCSSSNDDDLAVTLTDSVQSPTINLPNFVVDGEAPHLHYSPEKRIDKDWLTKMRTERRLVNKMHELAGPSPPKVVKLEQQPVPYGPRTSGRTPSKRQCKSNSKPKRPQSPLLKFFRVTNNNAMKCDPQCSPKSSANSSNTEQLHSQ